MSNQKVYTKVTNKLIEMLENGTVPWRKPWQTTWPKNLVSGRKYSGINAAILAMSTFTSPYWVTFNQAKKMGGYVNRGEKGTWVIFYSVYEKTVVDQKTGEETIKKFIVVKDYVVFNTDQCSGLKNKRLEAEKVERLTQSEKIEAAENIINGWTDKPPISHGGNRAFYRPSTDEIRVPYQHRFSSTEEYYSTLFHECSHATGHESRLDREGITKTAAFGDDVYSREELVAELGAAFLCGECSIERNQTLENSAAYLRSWINVLKGDSKLAVIAASEAQKAADYILGERAA